MECLTRGIFISAPRWEPLWVQSMTAAFVREGKQGLLPLEIRKVICENATEFEKNFQSWWKLLNFTYNPFNNIATAFVLTISEATVYDIYPIVALGIFLNGTLVHPLEHENWARPSRNRWLTVNVETCITREHQGYIFTGPRYLFRHWMECLSPWNSPKWINK